MCLQCRAVERVDDRQDADEDAMIDDDVTEAEVAPEAPLNGRSILFWFALLLGLGIIFVGARFLFQPLAAATAFGVPARGSPTFAYQWAKGTRDIVSGLLLL